MSNPLLYSPEVVYSFGSFRLDLSRQQLLRENEPVALTPKLFDTLLVLVKSAGRVVSRKVLIEKVWPDTIVTDTSISQNIFLLRKIVGDDAIETVPRRGYRFTVPVVLETRGTAPWITAVPPAPPDPDVRAQPGPRPRTRTMAVLAVVIVAALAVGWMAHEWRLRRRIAFARDVMALHRQSALVAAPFVIERRADGDRWLRTALPRMLADQLAGERLRVTPAETAIRMPLDLRLADAPEFAPGTAARIGRYTHADLILAGSFAALGDAASDQIALTARIQESRKGEVVAIASAVGPREQLFRLVESVSGELRAQLGIAEPAPDERRRAARLAAPSNLQAARLYARGVEELHRYNLLAARDALLAAATSDPSYAPTHRALCEVWSKLANNAKAKESAELALRSARDLPRAQQLEIEAVHSQAYRNFAKAVETRRTLTNFYPDNVDYALDLVGALFAAQRLPEALETARALRAKHPAANDPRIDFAEANVQLEMGTWPAAARLADRAAAQLRNGGSQVLLARTLSIKGTAQQRQGDEGWRATQQECLDVSRAAGFTAGAWRALNTLAVGYADGGQPEKAIPLLVAAEAEAKKNGDTRLLLGSAGNLGYVCNLAGRWEEARQAIERAIPLARAVGDKTNEAIAINMLADRDCGVGDYAAARRHASDALQRMRALSRKSGVATSLAVLGRVATIEGRFDDARSLLGESLETFESLGSKETKSVRMALAQLAVAEGRTADAMALIAQAPDSAEGMAVRAFATSDEKLASEALRAKPALHAHETLMLHILMARARGDAAGLDALAAVAAQKGDVVAARFARRVMRPTL